MGAQGSPGTGSPGTGSPGTASGGYRSNFQNTLERRFGRSRGDAVYLLFTGFVAMLVPGFTAFILGYPLLFPSLSPTVFTIFRNPLSATSSPRNTVVGHFAAIAVGFVVLWAFGLQNEPSVLQEGVTLPRVWAAATAVAVSESLLTAIRRPHTPAGTTTLLVSLGLFTTPVQILSLAGGIVLITYTGWAINRALGVPVPVWSPNNDQ